MQIRPYVELGQDFKGCGEPMLNSMIRILLKFSITCMCAKHRAVSGSIMAVVVIASGEGKARCRLQLERQHWHEEGVSLELR